MYSWIMGSSSETSISSFTVWVPKASRPCVTDGITYLCGMDVAVVDEQLRAIGQRTADEFSVGFRHYLYDSVFQRQVEGAFQLGPFQGGGSSGAFIQPDQDSLDVAACVRAGSG